MTGRTYTHWFKSCVAFSLVIHVIVFKILIETVNWNWISTLFGVICFASYYVMVFAMNMPILSPLIQPEINGEFLLIFTNIKAAICLVLLPCVALLPDITILVGQKLFWPTPTDMVMMKQKQNPDYTFDGFVDVYVPPLPTQLLNTNKVS